VLSFQEDAIGVDNMISGSDYPHSESTFPRSRKILAEILKGAPDAEQSKLASDHNPGIADGNTARVYNFDAAKLTVPA
jgi:predicted TIM-barrel fold metal-dependent hydrolase